MKRPAIIIIITGLMSAHLVLSCNTAERYYYWVNPEERFTKGAMISPNGKLIYEFSADNLKHKAKRKVFSLETGEVVYSKSGDSWEISDLRFSPDSNYLHFEKHYGDMRVHCFESGEETQYYKRDPIHKVDKQPAIFSPGMEYVAYIQLGMKNLKLNLWSLSDKKIDKSFDFPMYDKYHYRNTDFFFSDDGSLVVLLVKKNYDLELKSPEKFKIYDIQSGKELFAHESPRSTQSIKISSDNKYVAFSHRHEDIFNEFVTEVYDIETGKRVCYIDGKNVTFDLQAIRMAVSTEDQINLYSTGSFELCHSFSISEDIDVAPMPGSKKTIFFSQDGKMLLSLLSKGFVEVWSSENGNQLMSTLGYDAVFSPDSQSVVYLGYTIYMVYNLKRSGSWSLNIWDSVRNESRTLYSKAYIEGERVSSLRRLAISDYGDKLSFTSSGLHVWSLKADDFVYTRKHR